MAKDERGTQPVCAKSNAGRSRCPMHAFDFASIGNPQYGHRFFGLGLGFTHNGSSLTTGRGFVFAGVTTSR